MCSHNQSNFPFQLTFFFDMWVCVYFQKKLMFGLGKQINLKYKEKREAVNDKRK